MRKCREDGGVWPSVSGGGSRTVDDGPWSPAVSGSGVQVVGVQNEDRLDRAPLVPPVRPARVAAATAAADLRSRYLSWADWRLLSHAVCKELTVLFFQISVLFI